MSSSFKRKYQENKIFGFGIDQLQGCLVAFGVCAFFWLDVNTSTISNFYYIYCNFVWYFIIDLLKLIPFYIPYIFFNAMCNFVWQIILKWNFFQFVNFFRCLYRSLSALLLFVSEQMFLFVLTYQCNCVTGRQTLDSRIHIHIFCISSGMRCQ